MASECTCPNCGLGAEAPAPPKGRRPRFTPEERVQRQRKASRLYYHSHKAEIRVRHRAYVAQHYAANREVILERLRLKRLAAKAAKADKAAMAEGAEGAEGCEVPPGPKITSSEAFLGIPEAFRQDVSFDSST
jgi:hypothetical protein